DASTISVTTIGYSCADHVGCGDSRAFTTHAIRRPFPEELPRRLMQLYSWRHDVVGDPFIGRGTTAAVTAHLGRRVRALDRARDYVELTRAWVAVSARVDGLTRGGAPAVRGDSGERFDSQTRLCQT